MRTAIPADSMASVRVLRMVAARAWLRNFTPKCLGTTATTD
jgi:hypothetical protein